jgi:hypothetical protein
LTKFNPYDIIDITKGKRGKDMNSLCVTMLMNIENKYGKDSKEATTIKLYIISFENKKKYNINDVIAKYRELMNKKKGNG